MNKRISHLKTSVFFKKHIVVFCIVIMQIIINLLAPNTNLFYKCNAYQTNQISYAKISKDCYLYKNSSMSDDIQNVYFILPETYFVSLLSKINDNIYKVQYSNYIGFCYANTISVVSFVPNTPELYNVYFDIEEHSGTQIWSSPSDSTGTKLTTISAGTLHIEYIASALGEIPIGGTNNLWYYARFTPQTNSTKVYEGYIYSESVVNLGNIPNNLETETIIDDNTEQSDTITLNNTLKIILIILICLPFIVLFIASLIKSIKHLKHTKNKKQETLNTVNSPVIRASNQTSFVKKKNIFKSKPTFENHQENIETIEVSFPEYDYIDDDDLL